MRVVVLVSLRIGLLCGLVVGTSLLLADGTHRDLAVLLGQLAVEWALVTAEHSTGSVDE